MVMDYGSDVADPNGGGAFTPPAADDLLASAANLRPTLPEATAIVWKRSYDRDSVDRFLAEVEAERTRLLGEIERAAARRDTALEAAAASAAAAIASLGEVVLARSHELAQIEEQHAEIVATIRAAAETEAARILAAAEREVAAMHESTAALAALAVPSSTAPPAPADEINRLAYWPPPDPEGHASAG